MQAAAWFGFTAAVGHSSGTTSCKQKQQLQAMISPLSSPRVTSTITNCPHMPPNPLALSSIVCCAFPAGICLSVLLPAEPLLWERFQHSTLVSSWRRYFAFSLAVEQKLDPHGKYIFAGEAGAR
jgi:hypothetical protein